MCHRPSPPGCGSLVGSGSAPRATPWGHIPIPCHSAAVEPLERWLLLSCLSFPDPAGTRGDAGSPWGAPGITAGAHSGWNFPSPAVSLSPGTGTPAEAFGRSAVPRAWVWAGDQRCDAPGGVRAPGCWQGTAGRSRACFKGRQVFLGSGCCFALQAGVKM